MTTTASMPRRLGCALAAATAAAILAGCNDGAATEAEPTPSRTVTAGESAESPAPSESSSPSPASTLSTEQHLAYDQAVEATQESTRVGAELLERGELDATAERRLREVGIGKGLHLARGDLAHFEAQDWHGRGAVTVEPIKPVRVKPDNVVEFLACYDRSGFRIIGADGKPIPAEGLPRSVHRVIVYDTDDGWKVSNAIQLQPSKEGRPC